MTTDTASIRERALVKMRDAVWRRVDVALRAAKASGASVHDPRMTAAGKEARAAREVEALRAAKDGLYDAFGELGRILDEHDVPVIHDMPLDDDPGKEGV